MRVEYSFGGLVRRRENNVKLGEKYLVHIQYMFGTALVLELEFIF
jgi:hypothetical protein